MHRQLVHLVWIASLLAGCSGGGSPTDGVPSASAATVPPTEAVTSTTLSPTTTTTPVLPTSLAFNLPDGFMYPEGAAFDPTTGRVYVTSIQSGAVAVAEPGSDTATVWLEAGSDGRDMSALGIEFGGDRVWIVSNGLYEYRTDGTLIARHDPTGPTGGGLNDVTVTDDGVYVSDSSASLVWYLPLDASVETSLQPIDIGAVNAEAAQDAFNGIEALPDGTLVAGQYTGTQLFHIDPRVPSAVVIDLGDGYVTQQVAPTGSSRQVRYAGTDGMSLDGDVLWTTNTSGNAVDRVTLCPTYDCGTIVAGASDPLLSFPTDVQIAGDVVVVVNSQFPGLIGALEPTLPFTIAAIPINTP